MANSNQHAEDPMQHFTRAVKTIVNVPKSTGSQPAEHKTHGKYEEWRCPDCGRLYVKPTQHKHKG